MAIPDVISVKVRETSPISTERTSVEPSAATTRTVEAPVPEVVTAAVGTATTAVA